MAMIASLMADVIQTEMNKVSSTEPSDFASAFDTAASTYIQDNCLVNYSWAATLPATPFTPDPTIVFTASVSFPAFSIGNAPDINAWALLLQNTILGGIISPNDSTFLLPPMSFLLATPLTLAQSGLTDSVSALTYTCNEIITWIKTLINTVPVAGAHLAYTTPAPGAIMTSII